jgi:putative transposase
MPDKNLIREYASDSYYHIYNRGVEKRKIFLDEEDHAVFLNLLKRHLHPETQQDKYGRTFENYSNDIELLAYCLMPNHFHLFIYQGENKTVFTKLMRSVGVAYTTYFNKKYHRVGHLFQASFKAKRVENDAYLQHISRYIHLNPKDYSSYQWSSLPYYTGKNEAEWVKPGRILSLFKSKQDYLKFVKDYEAYKASLDEIKGSLATY